MTAATNGRSGVLLGVGAYLFLSGLYHLLDGGLMFSAGVGNSTLNILFASLSIALGLGLVLSAAGLFVLGSGGWSMGVAMLTLLVVLLDIMDILLRGTPAAAFDILLLLVVLVVIVRRQSGEAARAGMEEDESVHDIGTDYP